METVNKGSRRLSPSGLTLHWGSVFAGKKLSHHKLVAVDALVISLFYRPDSDIGAVWDQRATGLAVEAAKPNSKYDVYPNDGRIQSSTYYEVCNLSHSISIVLAD